MAKPILATDFKDDVMQEAMNGKRRYRMINNADGTVSFEDVTEYEQVGNSYGAGQINATNEAVNQSLDANKLVKDLDTISALTEEGYVPDALTIKQLNKSVGKGFQWYVDNGWLPAIPEEGEIPSNLEDCSWNMIRQLVQADTFKNYYKVGDTKSITLSSGEVVKMQVASINDGSGNAGAWYPKGTVDFISKDCLSKAYPLNSSNATSGGWASTNLRDVLNNTIFQTLPIDLQNVIIEKAHCGSNGQAGHTLVEFSDKLWLPSEYEIIGRNKESSSKENSSYNNQYSIFTNGGSAVKLRNNASATWWTASPFNELAGYWCRVTTTGGIGQNYTSQSEGVVLCFRVG